MTIRVLLALQMLLYPTTQGTLELKNREDTDAYC